ncbi:DUF4258 domain-containing protein [Thermicanus aegyptius]|uniref:DUF4258 domain-containing protein n=1 Tax=Thermicanus aegyptius TaxID=94009 RepID=UPI000492124A|nr:DUF4258 domain-containing protein [Thermicanus aegyptius]
MGCENPEKCRLKAAKHEKIQQTQALIGQRELERFWKYMQKGSAKLNLYRHAKRREFFRAFSEYQIVDALKNGWCIERNVKDGETTLLIIYHLKISSKIFRPIHLVCKFTDIKCWDVITVYDPRSKEYKWENNYQKRICFCKNQKEEDDI